jgi:N-carbamoylputrescine amidase
MNSKIVCVAAIQMDAIFGQREQNLNKAEGYIQQAAKQGAQLILLPELLPYGYGLNETVWNGAEPMDGPSVNWLMAQAKKYGAYIGFTFLETDGEDFYNAFVLADPNGKIAGRVRKSPAPAVESYFYREGQDVHIIDTELGRIGVNICYEILLHARVNELYEANIDIYLQPAAAGRPKTLIPGDVARLEKTLINARAIHYKALGVPIVMANRVGKLEGRLPGVMGYLKSSFLGGSYICDSNGQILKEMDQNQEEGCIIARVTLAPQYKAKLSPKRYGKTWAVPMPWFSLIYPMAQRMGERAYAKSVLRKSKALAMSKTLNNSLQGAPQKARCL